MKSEDLIQTQTSEKKANSKSILLKIDLQLPEKVLKNI